VLEAIILHLNEWSKWKATSSVK